MNTTSLQTTHLVQPGLELVDFGFLDQNVLLVQLLDDVLVVVFAVNVYQHSFDRRIALDERTYRVSTVA
jgi:hypothetical protein